MDLSKLTPAPWEYNRRWSNGCEVCPRITSGQEWVAEVVGAPHLGHTATLHNAAFIALARNAFDVMMRRRWSARYLSEGEWGVWNILGDRVCPGCECDPFTALVEADQWYKANVENREAVR